MDAGTPLVSADNRGLRYGDGVFETIRLEDGRMPLAAYHFDRLFSSLQTLGFETGALFTRERLEREILELAEKNRHSALARIRLMVFRGDGGLYEGIQSLNYAIQSWALPESFRELNSNGLVIDIFPEARKSTDRFSNLKSANYLPYILAARFAKENKLNDSLVLNTNDRIADSTIANIFMYKGGKYLTPPLTEGCVDGVMRRFLLAQMPSWGYEVAETPLSPSDLNEAEHLFLSNAIHGIRWVGRVGEKTFNPGFSHQLFAKCAAF